MLVDVQYLRRTKKLVASYVDKSGQIKLKYINWEAPTKYDSCSHDDPDRDPVYKSWDGKSVKKIPTENPDRYAIYEFLDALPDKEREEIFEFNLPKIYFVDIETEILKEGPNAGFPEAADILDEDGNIVKQGAASEVLAISIVFDDKIILMGTREMPKDMQKRIIDNTNKYFESYHREYKLKYIKYSDEFDMLYDFFHNKVNKMPVITGWNFLDYDWKFLMNRARKLSKTVNGREYTIDVRESSPTKRIEKVWATDFELPTHRMIFDYKQLYEICDTSIKVKESSSLDFVSSKLVGLEKIKFDGDLQNLYETDFETYMYYNAVDSILVQKIHEIRNYISIIYAVSSAARIKITDVVSQMNNALGSLAITEGVLRGRFREMDNVVLFKDSNKEPGGGTIAGGYVKEPMVGMNKWVAVYDFSSLYPSIQSQWFIAPENFIGIRVGDTDYCSNGNKIDFENHVVCVDNTVFNKRLSPTLCMLRDVFMDRKLNKKIMLEKKKEADKLQQELKKLESELHM